MNQRRDHKGHYNNLEYNENENTTYQILEEATKRIDSGKYIVPNTYIQKEETAQINNITLHLEDL